MSANLQDGAHRYTAPWGRLLWVMTILAVITLVAVGAICLRDADRNPWSWFGVVICAGLLTVPALFVVRGYRLEGRTLYIPRLFWETQFSLQDLESVEESPCFKGPFACGATAGCTVFPGGSGAGSWADFVRR